jgi:predicted transposase YbfD/YdcC
VAKTEEKSHGRIEIRELISAEISKEFGLWPHARQIFCIKRQRIVKGKDAQETVYGITSLSPEQADASRLLSLTRAHWGIENRLHNVKDGAFTEDKIRVRDRVKAQCLAALRNTALALFRLVGCSNIVESMEIFAEDKDQALRIVRNTRTK